MSNVRHRGNRMPSFASRRGGLKRRECRFARVTKAVLPRAVRPVAASAPLLVREALASRASSGAMPPFNVPCFCKAYSTSVSGAGLLCRFSLRKAESSVRVLRCVWVVRQPRAGAPGSCSGPAATGFARGGGFGLLAGVITQRTMHAGSVPLGALPNHSINRTCPGRPGHAGYLKR